jgi:hypothetical protein
MGARRLWMLACILSLVCVSLTGCDLLNPASRLYGKWKLDVDATIDRAAGGSELKKSALRAMWALIGGEVTMEFRPDGTGEIQGASALGAGNETGTWKLVSADRDTLRVEITSDRGTYERVLRMLDANTLEVDLPVAGEQTSATTFRRMEP